MSPITSLLPLALVAAAYFSPAASAAPLSPVPAGAHHLAVHSRAAAQLSGEALIASHLAERDLIRRKYGVAPDGESPLRKRSSGSSGGTVLAGTSMIYYTSVSIGTPPVTYEVQLDSGSADLVLLTNSSAGCTGGCVITAQLYNPALSSTAKVTDTVVSATYGGGLASYARGKLVADEMSFGGFSLTQNLAACPSSADIVMASDETGLWGLAPRASSFSNSTGFIEQLYDQGKLAEPVFALALSTQSSNAEPDVVVPGGSMSVGTLNSSLYSGSVGWVATSSNASWSVPLDGVAINGTAIANATTNAILIDSGTNYIVAPSDIAASIYANIPGATATGGFWSYPCGTSVSLSVTLGGKAYTLPPSSFNRGSYSASVCLGVVIDIGVLSTSPGAMWILGTPFMSQYYTAFRFSPPAVGFATLASDAQAAFAKQGVPTSGSTAAGALSSGGSSSTSVPAVQSSAAQPDVQARKAALIAGVVGAVALALGR